MSKLGDILHGMDSVGLREVAPYALMDRVDTKYVFGADLLPTLLESVRDDYRVLQTQGHVTAPYLTLYFDTFDRRCYLRHHNEQRTRHKVRVRQYRTTGATFLEVKAKDNKGRTQKTRMAVAGLCDSLASELQAYVHSVTGQHAEWRPALLTEFRRITLVHKHCTERVTIDLDLAFSQNADARDESVLRAPRLVIAEVKQESDNRRTSLRSQLRHMKTRPSRMSKYCVGSALLDPGLKRNRFKGQLRAISQHTDAE